jgi:hypothetical protein
MNFRGNLLKSRQDGEKFVKKDVKKIKNYPFFCPVDFSKSYRYQTIGSPM